MPSSMSLKIVTLSVLVLVLREVLVSLGAEADHLFMRHTICTHDQKMSIPFLVRLVRLDNFRQTQMVLAPDEQVNGFPVPFESSIPCLHALCFT